MQPDQQKLIEELRAPIRSFRLIALETVIQKGFSEEVLEELEALKACDEDPECQTLISHAISAVKTKIFAVKAESSNLQKFKTDAPSLIEWWKNSQENEKMHFLSGISGKVPPELSKVGPELLSLNNSKRIESRIIRIFSGQWPHEKIEILKKYIFSSELSVKMAAFRAITHQRPELLSPDLPTLLSAKEPQIKAFAIRALVKIDPEETLNHLEGMLFSDDTASRFAGVINCTFLPFELIKPLLLKFISAEANLELINRAGWILKMNPDEETPYRLFEIAEGSYGEKAAAVKEILQDAFRLLNKSGIISGKIEEYKEGLQNWVAKKNALRFAKQLVGLIETNQLNEETKSSIKTRIKEKDVAEALSSTLSWPVSDFVKEQISNILATHANSDQTIDSTPVTGITKNPHDTPESSGSRVFDAEVLNTENYARFSSEITTILTTKISNASLVTFLLKKLGDLKIANHSAAAQMLLNSADSEIVVAATNYLASVDPDSLFSYLGKIVAAKEPKVVKNAIGIIKQFDFNQAISYLKNLLFSIHPEKQRIALDCISQFDFHLVRDILAEFIIKCHSDHLVKNALCHFEANPDSENIYCLYRIERRSSGVTTRDASDIRQKQSQFLSKSGIYKIIDENVLSERFAREIEKEKNLPAYAYKKTILREQRSSYIDQLLELPNAALNLFKRQHKTVKLAVGFSMIALSLFLFFPSTTGVSKNLKVGAIKTREMNAQGRVVEFSKEWLIIELDNGERYTLYPESPFTDLPKQGEKVEVVMIPYRRTSNLNYSAKLKELRRLPAKSPGNIRTEDN